MVSRMINFRTSINMGSLTTKHNHSRSKVRPVRPLRLHNPHQAKVIRRPTDLRKVSSHKST